MLGFSAQHAVHLLMHPAHSYYSKTLFPLFVYGKVHRISPMGLEDVKRQPSSLLIQLSSHRSWNGMSLFLLEKLTPAGFSTALFFRCWYICCSGVLFSIVASFPVGFSLTNIPQCTSFHHRSGRTEQVGSSGKSTEQKQETGLFF